MLLQLGMSRYLVNFLLSIICRFQALWAEGVSVSARPRYSISIMTAAGDNAADYVEGSILRIKLENVL